MADPISDPFADENEGPAAGEFSYDQHPPPTQDTAAPSAPAAETGASPVMNTVDLVDKKENIFPDISSNAAKPVEAKSSGIYEITVSDPEKKGDGMYAYVTYKVTTKLETSPGKFRISAVTRRYSDFLWLRKRLVANEDGWLVPPMPEKAIIGRFSPMFVDCRRRGLELFLNRLAQHPVLSQHEDVRLFLNGQQEFEDYRDGKPVPEDVVPEPSPDKKPAKGFFDYLNEIGQIASNTWGAGKEREKTQDDLACESIGAYTEQLSSTVEATHKNITVLTKRMKDIANAWFDFGFSCTLLGQFETEQEEQHLGNAFAKLGNCADRLSVLLTQKVDSQIVHFQEPFEDFLRTIDAVNEILRARAGALLSYQTALSALESKQATLTRYQGRPGKEERALIVESEVTEAQRKVDDALHRLQKVTERVFQETARFRQETRVNFKHIMQDFVRMQIENAKKMQTAWESVLPDIESMPYDDV